MTEFLEIYDENHNPTGIKKDRKEVHKNGFLHKTIHLWVVDFENRILIQKRSANKSTHPLMWDVSCAGHVTFGQTSKEAAVSELFEETGLVIKESSLNYITTIEKIVKNEKVNDHEIYDVYLVYMDIDSGLIKIDTNEVAEVKLMDAKTFFKKALVEEDFIKNEKEYSLMKKILLK